MKNYLLLREKALANILVLFDYWKLEYKKINDDEYDFINPTREDNNFGACRFNIRKGMGGDFTGTSFKENDFRQIGMGFSKEDFSSVTAPNDRRKLSFGFDIIGLCQRLHNLSTYSDAAKLLNTQLGDISKFTSLHAVTLDAVVKRQQEKDTADKKKLLIARRTWGFCVPLEGTIGEKYLRSRKIFVESQTSIRFHSKILNMELKKNIPAILLKVSLEPDGPLQAIHRIYLSSDGSRKADVSIPKMALGNIKGLGIWFGEKDDTLYIVEGPENALSILSLGYKFVVSTIDAANFGNLSIPSYVSKIVLLPDGDNAGREAAKKASQEYKKFVNNIKLMFPPKNKNPKWDWNDELQVRGLNGQEKS